jgi:tetratricopeptide (TPR) repeat protein
MKRSFPGQAFIFFISILLVVTTLAGQVADDGPPVPDPEKLHKFVRASDVLLSGKLLFFGRSYGKAQKVFEKCLKIFPAYADAYFYLSRISFRKREYALALEQIKWAKVLYPATAVLREPAEDSGQIPASFYKWHGDVLTALHRYPEAEAQYLQALKIGPANGDTYYQLAEWHYRMGHYREALMNFNIAAAVGLKDGEIDPGFKADILKGLAEPGTKALPDSRLPTLEEPARAKPRLGLKIGLNHNRLVFGSGLTSGWQGGNGLRLGASLSLDIVKHVALQPEVYYGVKGAVFRDSFGGEPFRQRVELHYIEIPLLLRVEGPPRWLPALLAGLYGAFNVGSRAVTHYAGRMTEEAIGAELRSLDFGLVVGLSADFRLGPGNRQVTLDLRYSLGLADIKNESDLSGYSITHRTWSFMLGYGF